ncbi:MAG: hypothetical protein ABSF29_00375 [Tepidisphaeraceae bacterium]|jgi:hypothetical protein
MVITLGESLLSRDEKGDLRVRIATVFPRAGTIVTLPGIHASQREAYVDSLNRSRKEQGKPLLSEAEADAEMELAVDLIVDEQGVLIRPDPTRMDLAREADELLEEVVPKRLIKYLLLSDRRVRDSLKMRGECWRMFLPPTAPLEIRRMIAEARSSIEGNAIYYYGPFTGTRLLTFENLRRLAELDDNGLRKHLAEIGAYGSCRNRAGYCEIEYFMADHLPGAPGMGEFELAAAASSSELRPKFEKLCQRLVTHIPPEFRRDDLDEPAWRNRMFASLMTQRNGALVDDASMGLDPEFSMRVEWLPGCRIEEGELILDPAIEEPYGRKQEKRVSSVVRGLILNLVQEYGDLEYINLGGVLPSATRNENRGGRREVYVAQIKQRRAAAEVLQIIRMQKWGVRERLDEGKDLETALTEAEEYTEYVQDRRLACRQLGMNLLLSQTARKVSEQYYGCNTRYHGRRIWSPYFQRDYIGGVATDQISARKLADRSYAMIFARLLGQAAASNIVLGRAELSGEMVFDVGDEIVAEDASGMPTQIIVSDHVGTFVDWRGSLETRAVQYARPARRRLEMLSERREFVDAYLSGFVERFVRVQEEYARHRRAFDTLFKHRPWDEGGSLAKRWFSVLDRLRTASPRALSDIMRQAIGAI